MQEWRQREKEKERKATVVRKEDEKKTIGTWQQNDAKPKGYATNTVAKKWKLELMREVIEKTKTQKVLVVAVVTIADVA